MKRRTFLAGIAAAIASYAVPGARDRLVFTTTADLTKYVPRAIVVGFDKQGRRITEEPEVEEEDGRVTFRIAEIETIESITVPAMPAPDAPPPTFSIVIS